MVNIASIDGKKGNPNSGASMGVLIALTKSLAKDVARTYVLVNCVDPSVAGTEILAVAPSRSRNGRTAHMAATGTFSRAPRECTAKAPNYRLNAWEALTRNLVNGEVKVDINCG